MRVRFDRGTLLLEGLAAEHAAELPQVVFDPRSDVLRAPAWRYGEITQCLRRLGVALLDDAAGYLSVDAAAWAPVDLRPYQRAALCAWESAGRRGVVVLPTGSGKTRVALAAMAASGRASLCLVPTRVLLHQWRGELARFYSGPVGAWGDGERQRAAIQVITFESAYRNMAQLGRQYGLMVVDEAHHFGDGVRDEALEMAIAPERLGLTATPPEPGRAAAGLATLVGPVVHRCSVHELAGRYLADFELVVLHIPLEPDERAIYDRSMALFRPVNAAFRRFAPTARWSDFVQMAMSSPEGRRALAAWRRCQSLVAFTRGKARTLGALLREHRNGRVLVFTSNNDTAYAIARRHLIMPFTCDIKRAERDAVLERFRTGELKALVSARVLNEGIDVPDADVAIIVAGSHGAREHIQRIGRLLRPREGKRAIIYELVADGTSETRQAERRRRGLGTPRSASL